EPTVLDVPRCDTGFSQCGGHGPHVVHRDGTRIDVAKPRQPAAAMNDDGNRVRSFRCRHAQLPELEWISTVGNTLSTWGNDGVCQSDGVPALSRQAGTQQ